jgi:small subunit ribosomal protein S4
MARNLDSKCKQCRRVGEKLFLKGEKCFTAKCPLVRRNYPPGQHGQKSSGRVSSFGLQLREKQKARRMYRLLERQFRGYYDRAIRQRGNTGERFQQFLECRLDNVVYRLALAKSRDQARQLITHGHIFVNGRLVNIPSFQVRPTMEIKVNPARAKLAFWTEMVKSLSQSPQRPEWLSFKEDTLSGTIERIPSGDELATGLSMPQIVEYYSR